MKILTLSVLTVAAMPTTAQPQSADAPDLSLYGSLRVHANVVSVDDAVGDKSDTEFGLTDAYSRVGATLDFDLGETEISFKTELGLNVADLKLGDPSFFDDEDVRVYRVKASGDWGSLLVGKDWLPYYNNVGYPVDYFSSIYAGYTTYAYFRERMVAYTTPTFDGFSGTVARIERTGGGASGWHGTLSHTGDKLTMAVGMENMDGATADTYGASVSYMDGPWYLAAKIEGQDGRDAIYNGFIQHRSGKWTSKLGVGFGDQYSGTTLHAGVDYQLNDDWKLFAETYAEQENYALLFDGAKGSSDYLGAGGFGARQSGRAVLFGARFDFATP